MKLLVSFSKKKGSEPLIAKIVRDTGVLINVNRAYIESMSGEMLIEVPDADSKIVCEKLISSGAEVEVLEDSVFRDEDECIDCGACISICPQEVFYFDEDWHLHMDEEKCVLCGKCTEACPHGALSIYD